MNLFKKLSVTIILLISMLSLTACSSIPLNIDGYYWFKNKAIAGFISNYSEESVYDVSFVNTTLSNSDEVKVEGVAFENVIGSYVTTLKTANDKDGNQFYEYTTKFSFTADLKNTTGATEVVTKVSDSFETKTLFNKDLSPISSHKEYSAIRTTNNDTPNKYSYVYDISYDNSKNQATCVLTENPDNETTKKVTNLSFSKFSDGAFVDNDILLLIGRVFDVAKDFSRQFNTIDVLSNKNHKMLIYASAVEDKLDVKKIESGYLLNGEQQNDIDACHLNLKINHTFSGYPIECYYATNHETHRHRLIECYSKLTNELGYLKYKLKSVTINN